MHVCTHIHIHGDIPHTQTHTHTFMCVCVCVCVYVYVCLCATLMQLLMRTKVGCLGGEVLITRCMMVCSTGNIISLESYSSKAAILSRSQPLLPGVFREFYGQQLTVVAKEVGTNCIIYWSLTVSSTVFIQLILYLRMDVIIIIFIIIIVIIIIIPPSSIIIIVVIVIIIIKYYQHILLL